jgi:hypothetical protein
MNMLNQENFVMAISFAFVGAVVVFWLLKWAKLRRRTIGQPKWDVESTAVVLKSGGGQPGSVAYYAELKYSYTGPDLFPRAEPQIHSEGSGGQMDCQVCPLVSR